LTSDGGVIAATYGGNSTTVAIVKFDDTGAYSWYAEIVTDTYSPFPANSRGLEVDTSDNVYVAARRVGNSTTITANAIETTVPTPDSSPNGLLLSLSGSNGGLNWTRTVGSGASTKASTVAVSGTTVYLGTSAKAMMQFDAYREKYTWKPAVFKFDSSGVSHK